MQRDRRYLYNDDVEQYGADDPGCQLREALGQTRLEIGDNTTRKFQQLLHTATERGILREGDINDPYTHETVLRILQVAQRATPDQMKKMRL